MKVNNHDDIESDEVLQELQELWDEKCRRIDKLLTDHPEWQPKRLNLNQSGISRYRRIAEYCVLLVANVIVGLFATRLLLPDTYYLFRVVGYLILFANAMMSMRCIVALFSSLFLNPWRMVSIRAARSCCAHQFALLTTVAMVVLIGLSQFPEGDKYAMKGIKNYDRLVAITIVEETLVKI